MQQGPAGFACRQIVASAAPPPPLGSVIGSLKGHRSPLWPERICEYQSTDRSVVVATGAEPSTTARSSLKYKSLPRRANYANQIVCTRIPGNLVKHKH